MAKNDKTTNRSDVSGRPGVRSRSALSEAESLMPRQTGGIRLQLPPGEADIEELQSVTREWLIPRLVEKFLRVHRVQLKHSRQHATRLQPSHLGDSAGSAAKEIRSQAEPKKPIPGT
jgi:hypothetical protein